MKPMNICLPRGYEVVEPTPALIAGLAGSMRPADAAEVMASSGHTALEALTQSAVLSDYCRMTLYHGKPLSMGGLVLVDEVMACPWQLCSVDSARHGKGVLRLGKQALDHWLTVRPFLFNMADARNAESLLWLKWLGFEFGEAVPHGPQGLPFIPFWTRAKGCT
jgi:hypothetical protein